RAGHTQTDRHGEEVHGGGDQATEGGLLRRLRVDVERLGSQRSPTSLISSSVTTYVASRTSTSPTVKSAKNFTTTPFPARPTAACSERIMLDRARPSGSSGAAWLNLGASQSRSQRSASTARAANWRASGSNSREGF